MRYLPVLLALLSIPAFMVPLYFMADAQESPEPILGDETPILSKFDGGLYEKLKRIEVVHATSAAPGEEEPRYPLLIIVDKGPDDSYETAAKNKASLVGALEDIGAKNIRSATTLSFVTADVPLSEIADISENSDVHIVGDGALEFEASMDITRQMQVINGAPRDLPMSSSKSYDGSGVRVSVIDTGINSTALNIQLIDRIYCNDGPCTSQIPPINRTHGTSVAGVIAASNAGQYNGIAPGTSILDAYLIANSIDSNIVRATEYAHALQWSLNNDADVVNISSNSYPEFRNEAPQMCGMAKSVNFVAEEAMDQGMVVVVSAGNAGRNAIIDSSPNGENTTNIAQYSSVLPPACAHNPISVGAMDDNNSTEFSDFGLYYKTSRGPTSTGLLKPEIVAPGVDIPTICAAEAMSDCRNPKPYSDRMFHTSEGTSYAAPMVSAASAILKQANPAYTPLEIKIALLLGANWTAPVPCTSVQFENVNLENGCSSGWEIIDEDTVKSNAALGLINNVGFGILDIAGALSYTDESAPGHIITGNIAELRQGPVQYSFDVTSTSQSPSKVILSWLVRPSGNILGQATADSVQVDNLDMTLRMPNGTIIRADSAKQTNEFAVFNPDQTGTYHIMVMGPDGVLDGRFALASTERLTKLPSLIAAVAQSQIDAVSGQTITLDASPSTGRGALTYSWVQRENSAPMADLSGTSSATLTFTVPHGSPDNANPMIFDVIVRDAALSGIATVMVDAAYSFPTIQYPHIIFEEDFASLSGWRNTADDDWDSRTTNPTVPDHTGSNRAALASDCDLCIIEMISPVNLAPHSGLSLSLWRYMSTSVDSGEYLKIDALDAKNEWKKLAEWSADEDNDDGKWHMDTIPLDDIASENFRLRISSNPSSSNERISLDDIRITAASPAIFYDSMDDLSDWTSSGWVSRIGAEHYHYPDHWDSEELVAEAESCNPICSLESMPIDLSQVNNAELTLWRFMDTSYDSGEYLRVETYDGSSWTRIFDWSANGGDDDDVWYLESYKIPARHHTADFKIRFLSNPSASYEEGNIDSVRISSAQPVQPDEITDGPIMYDFDTLDKWRNTGHSNWRASTPYPQLPQSAEIPSPNKVAFSSNCDSLCIIETADAIDLSGYASATINMWRYVSSGFDYGEYLKVEAYNGRAWHTVFNWQASAGDDDNTWHKESAQIPPEYLVDDFEIKITAKSTTGSERAMVDHIHILKGEAGDTPEVLAESALYVSSTNPTRILAYMPDGTFIDTIVRQNGGGLTNPWGIDFGPDGYLYVADNSRNKIFRYTTAGVPAGASSTDATWARTMQRPYGLEWNGDILYASTYYGVEKFDKMGSSLGYHGDASNNPAASGTPRLFLSYDLAFGGDKMYATALAPYKIYEYDVMTGQYEDTVSAKNQRLYYSIGLAWDASSSDSLVASGDDPGKVIRINPGSRAAVTGYTSLIDDPYGMTVDSAGAIYVANRDDHNIIKIDGSSSSVFVPAWDNGLAYPRDVTFGPAPPGGASGGAAGSVYEPLNELPEFGLFFGNGTEARYIELAQNDTVSIEIRGSDPDDDPVTYHISENPEFIRMDGDTIKIDTAGIAPDVYLFRITANDTHDADTYDYAIDVRK